MGKRQDNVDGRLRSIAQLLDKLDRSVERIELVTVVKDPSTPIAADAYNGLRKQIVAAAGERMAHLGQLAQFDVALRAGASADDLASLVREWRLQAGLDLLEDATIEGAFEMVGPEDGDRTVVVTPAYVDSATGRVVRSGIAERVNDGGDEAATAGTDEDAATEDVADDEEAREADDAEGAGE